ncbi:LysM peptidoglycan-binding domain-containing protein [Streptomyces pinistramenti]|uniref:LysM peptidoglycan-binding domain-containing protein n=1 Tax=Streptomyces pinistramenti TaxID=2884812 RepID=UPI001D0935F9|nr:LysM peptidoglycan-binding domain-containing protein [Streptomyces pinistramenti]MCB5910377.1 LysM peptidoglycan-binding domain-containing protein [Streptomyces pinistramenti]
MPLPHAPARRPWPLALVRAAGSLAALAALVAGLPLALLRIGTLPAGLPTAGQVGDALMAPDDGGQVLFTALTLVCWVLWAWFVASLLVEAAALLRRRAAPRVRGLAAPQRLAAVLLGGLLAIPSATALAATPATAVSHTATATPGPATPHVPAQQRAAHTGPRHVVGATGETVWDLAEQYLGDGRRHSELRALNPHLPHSATLPAGTVVNLPASTHVRTELAAATPASAETAPEAGTGEAQAATYTVAAGDSLSAIAGKKLGDADRWPDLYAANKDTVHDPDLIYPGEHLTLPPQANPAPPHHESDAHDPKKAHSHESSGPDGDTAPPPHEHHGQDPDGAGDKAATEASGGQSGEQHAPSSAPPAEGPAAGPDAAPSAAAPSPKPATPAPGTPVGAASARQAVSPATIATIAAIGGGVLAAALLSALATRRILQQRRRHRGHRIALPQDEAAATEQDLRTAEAALDTTMLDGALRTAAVHLAATGRELPPLSAAVIGPSDIVLHLTAPADPVPPFTADTPQRWSCPTRGAGLLPTGQCDDVEAPYPALVSLGWDERGHLVLVDLEAVGHLHLTGPDRHRVLRTIALELAASEFADHLTVVPVGQVAPGLQEEMPERVSACAGLTEALGALRVHHAEQQRALAVLEAGSMHRARTGVDTAAAWSTHVVLAGNLDTPDSQKDLVAVRQVIDAQPRSATALVTTGDESDVPEGAQVVCADVAAGPVAWVLPGTAVEVLCSVQSLSDEHYAQALEVLATTRADDVAAPQSAATAPRAVPDLPPALADNCAPTTDHAAATEPAGPAQVPGLLAQFAVYDDAPDSTAAQAEAPLPAAQAPGGPAAQAPSPAAPEPETTPPEGGGVPAVPAPPDLTENPPSAAPVPVSVPEGGDEDAYGAHPAVLVLGPVDVDGARGTVENKRRRTSIELAAWLVLHPGLDHHALDEAMWPGREATLKYRNATVSRLRTWLGTDDDGNPYLPRIATSSDARYAMAPTVACDWHRFQHLTHTAATPGPHAAGHLRAALGLVRGRPFSSVDRRRYAWAEHMAQDMISAIVDAAADLAEHCLAARDPRGALWAATKGLDAAPEMENLYRVLFRAYAALGDHTGLERAAERLDRLNMELGVDMEEATAAILSQLSKSA